MRHTTKFCIYCEKNITIQNFTTHKKTHKHIKNKLSYKPPNLLELKEDNNIKYLKIQLDDIKKNIDNILNNF